MASANELLNDSSPALERAEIVRQVELASADKLSELVAAKLKLSQGASGGADCGKAAAVGNYREDSEEEGGEEDIGPVQDGAEAAPAVAPAAAAAAAAAVVAATAAAEVEVEEAEEEEEEEEGRVGGEGGQRQGQEKEMGHDEALPRRGRGRPPKVVKAPGRGSLGAGGDGGAAAADVPADALAGKRALPPLEAGSSPARNKIKSSTGSGAAPGAPGDSDLDMEVRAQGAAAAAAGVETASRRPSRPSKDAASGVWATIKVSTLRFSKFNHSIFLAAHNVLDI